MSGACMVGSDFVCGDCKWDGVVTAAEAERCEAIASGSRAEIRGSARSHSCSPSDTLLIIEGRGFAARAARASCRVEGRRSCA